jgi:membrane protein required for colicin V production
MPIALLDIILLAVMLISGFLALVRGFMREILSIMAWGCAAAAAALGSPKVLPFVKTQINNDYIALAVTIAGLFLGTLIIVSVITVRISDKILDSRIGALDRTLGFIFGLARGLLIVVIAFIFFDWLVQEKSQPSWVVNAKSRVILKGTGDAIQALLPEDMDKYLSSILKKKPKGDEDGDGGAPPPEQRSDTPPGTTLGQSDQQGYNRSDRSSMRQLIDGRGR